MGCILTSCSWVYGHKIYGIHGGNMDYGAINLGRFVGVVLVKM